MTFTDNSKVCLNNLRKNLKITAYQLRRPQRKKKRLQQLNTQTIVYKKWNVMEEVISTMKNTYYNKGLIIPQQHSYK